MKLWFNNVNVWNQPCIQDDLGGYYLKPDGFYYEPTREHWLDRPLPEGVIDKHDGSHATPNYYNGMKQLPWDIYAPAYSMLYSNTRMKCVKIYNHPTDGYSVYQDMGYLDNTGDELLLLVGHTENFTKLWEIVEPNQPFVKSNGSMGHFHMCKFLKGQPVDFWYQQEKDEVPAPVEPTCEEKLASIQAILDGQAKQLEATQRQLDSEKANYAQAINDLSTQLQTLQSEKATLESNTAQLQANHEKDLSDLRKIYEDRITVLEVTIDKLKLGVPDQPEIIVHDITKFTKPELWKELIRQILKR